MLSNLAHGIPLSFPWIYEDDLQDQWSTHWLISLASLMSSAWRVVCISRINKGMYIIMLCGVVKQVIALYFTTFDMWPSLHMLELFVNTVYMAQKCKYITNIQILVVENFKLVLWSLILKSCSCYDLVWQRISGGTSYCLMIWWLTLQCIDLHRSGRTRAYGTTGLGNAGEVENPNERDQILANPRLSRYTCSCGGINQLMVIVRFLSTQSLDIYMSIIIVVRVLESNLVHLQARDAELWEGTKGNLK